MNQITLYRSLHFPKVELLLLILQIIQKTKSAMMCYLYARFVCH